MLKRAVEKENLSLKGSIGHLYKYAKRAGWEVVVERKDVVYKL